MDTATFQKLTYGNIISEAGRKLGVTHTLKTPNGSTFAIFCGGEAFELADAGALTLVSSASSRTFLAGSNDGKLVLMGETIPPPIQASLKKK
jgi:hypothetical protein